MPEINNFGLNDFSFLGRSPVQATQGERTAFLPSGHPMPQIACDVITDGITHA